MDFIIKFIAEILLDRCVSRAGANAPWPVILVAIYIFFLICAIVMYFKEPEYNVIILALVIFVGVLGLFSLLTAFLVKKLCFKEKRPRYTTDDIINGRHFKQ